MIYFCNGTLIFRILMKMKNLFYLKKPKCKGNFKIILRQYNQS